MHISAEICSYESQLEFRVLDEPMHIQSLQHSHNEDLVYFKVSTP